MLLIFSNDRFGFIEVFRRKHSKAVNYNTSILALFLDKKGRWRGEIVRYSYKIADSIHIQNVSKQKIEIPETWNKTWKEIRKKKYHKMPSLTPFFCNNKQINVFIGDGDFYACDYYDRFGHHSTSCTERGIPCEPIIKFLEYIKLMDSEFSFDIP